MSRLPIEIFLALRYLRPKRTFVSVITLISVMGVLLGVAVLIIVISVMSGFDKQLRDSIMGFNADLRITKRGDIMEDYAAVMNRISKNPEVRGVAPEIMGQVLVKTQTDTNKPLIRGPLMRGIDPKYESKVSDLTTNIVAGHLDFENHGVVVGSEFAREMNLHLGDRLAIYSPDMLQKWEASQGKEAVLPEDYVVTGIFDVGYYEYNQNVILLSLEAAQELWRLDAGVHMVLVKLRDPFQAETVRKQLLSELGPDYDIRPWTELSSTLLDALAVEKNVMFYLLFFIMIVAAFGIMNSLITFVVQKTREIGVLKALGATRAQVLWIFLSQSLFVGTMGVVSGFSLGLLAVHYRNEFLHAMRRWTGLELFPASIYNFTDLPALLDPRDILLICGSTLVICLLAGLVPAWIAGRLRPVEALRHE
jgi:lipoprotein-releasing system permease protein